MAAEGLVEFRPRFGFFARSLGTDGLAEIFEIRVELEWLAAGHSLPGLTEDEVATLADCVQRLDEARDQNEWLQWNRVFHFTLYGAAERPRLLAMIYSLWDTIEAYQRLHLQQAGRPAEAQADHWTMLDAVRSRDVSTVQSTLRVHIERAGERIASWLKATNESRPAPGAQDVARPRS